MRRPRDGGGPVSSGAARRGARVDPLAARTSSSQFRGRLGVAARRACAAFSATLAGSSAEL